MSGPELLKSSSPPIEETANYQPLLSTFADLRKHLHQLVGQLLERWQPQSWSPSPTSVEDISRGMLALLRACEAGSDWRRYIREIAGSPGLDALSHADWKQACDAWIDVIAAAPFSVTWTGEAFLAWDAWLTELLACVEQNPGRLLHAEPASPAVDLDGLLSAIDSNLAKADQLLRAELTPAQPPEALSPVDISIQPLQSSTPDERILMATSTHDPVDSQTQATNGSLAPHFYGVVENLPVAVFAVDANETITFLNQRGHELLRNATDTLGFGPDEIVGNRLSYLSENFEGFQGLTARIKTPFRVTVGAETWEIRVSPITGTDGRRLGTTFSIEDITAQLHVTRDKDEARSDQQAVTNVLGALDRARTVVEAAQIALDTVRAEFGWAYGSFWALDTDAQVLKFSNESGTVTPEFRKVTEQASFAQGVGLSGRTWQQRDLVFVEDLSKVTDCVRAPAARKAGVKSGVCFPIEVNGQLIGTMDFFALETLTLSDSRRETLRSVGRLVSQSITRLQESLKQQEMLVEVTRIQNMMDNLPINVIMANRDAELIYFNPASLRTLKRIEHLLPRPVEQLKGEKFDIFHKSPEFQRRIVSDPSNLPHKARIRVGEETLDLLVSAIKDGRGNYVGPMITWDIVTKQVEQEDEMARIQNMMDNLPINVIMANRDSKIVYMNPATVRTLKTIEHLLPVPVDQLKGQSFDILHKAPEYQRRIVGDPKNLPHRARIKVGPETLDLLVSAITNHKGEYLGPMVTWSVITGNVKMADDFERDVKGVVEIVTSAATQMQASSRSLAASSEETARQSQVVAAASEEATRNVETVSSAAEELSKSISEIARHVQEASRMTSSAVTEADRTNVTIKQLGDSSNEIGQVVKVITSIAQQTNLLALNATIEAARAGEAGKGFAVVANEVKELARQTAKATEEISQKINAIQGATGVAVTAIASISDSIRKINEISTTIASAVEEQSAATNEISRNVSEAARGTSEVSSNISGVSQAAEEGGRGASDILVAAEGLTQESVRLDSVTSQFLERLRKM